VRGNQSLFVAVVDDDESFRDSIQNLLRSAGMRAEAFSTAEDLLDGGQLGDMACIILDIRMPGMSGLQLQRRLADDGYRIPIIFVTAHGGRITGGGISCANTN
jgi:FixJ family two-component response regulator